MSHVRSDKEKKDPDIIDDGVTSIAEFGKDDLVPHFIYCGNYYWEERTEKLKQIFLGKMRKYGIQSSLLTMLNMWRWNLVTKEKLTAEKLKNEFGWKDYEGPINDDLERLLNNFQNHKGETYNTISLMKYEETVDSYFTPKLTEEELELVEKRDTDHLKTYLSHFYGFYPDDEIEEMEKSDSKPIFRSFSEIFGTAEDEEDADDEDVEVLQRPEYVHGWCRRSTFVLGPWVLYKNISDPAPEPGSLQFENRKLSVALIYDEPEWGRFGSIPRILMLIYVRLMKLTRKMREENFDHYQVK